MNLAWLHPAHQAAGKRDINQVTSLFPVTVSVGWGVVKDLASVRFLTVIIFSANDLSKDNCVCGLNKIFHTILVAYIHL